MRITFLGGADEIGASCAVVDFDDHRFLVDVGQRMNAPAGELLPDFSFLEIGPPIDAILLTHSHTDHIGALAALEAFLPEDCPILGTEATLAIAKVMLQDSQRIIAQHRQGEGQLAHFAPAAVSAVIARFESVPWGKAQKFGPCRITWFPSGHILGAGMIEIQENGKSVLFSGDVSVADQQTVPGVFAPAITPQVLILESTYGDRMHAHRPTQERRLVKRVEECLAAGGHVLFPTFALGRAQEVLVILSEAMRRGDMRTVPVYGDGMVRAISRVYNRFPDDLSPTCRRRWEEGLDPIFPDDLPIYRIKNQDEREVVAAGPPCVVVASSGMLQGGASQFYAREWIGNPGNLILITGYQDEESPGQALLDLASNKDDQPRYFKLGGIRAEVKCGVESFELSAHADNGELTSLASKFKADFILPVHGEGGARQGLAQSLMAVCKAEVILPENGTSYDFDHLQVKPRPLAARRDPLSAWPPWDTNSQRKLDLAMFHDWLVSIQPKIDWISFEELAEIWRGPESISLADRKNLHRAVYEDWQPYFVPDAKRPHLLRLTPSENLPRLLEGRPLASLALASAQLREAFSKISGLRRFGFFPEESTCQLEFAFPEAAATQFVQRLRDFEDRTGWKTRIVGSTSDEELIRVASKVLETDLAGRTSVDADRFQLRVAGPLRWESYEIEPDVEMMQEQFHRRTGWHLVLDAPKA
ncbi:MBL fold metallo-hydrolase [bacterium]|nr:MBL fold metallo-hydrolase [bacterium]